MDREKRTLEDTPTWAVSIFCFAFFFISFIIDVALHHLTQFLKRRSSKSLNNALRKIKTEMMILGFISLLLTIAEEVPVSKICVAKAVANSFLPCKDPQQSSIEPNVSSAAQISDFNSNTNLSGITNDPFWYGFSGVKESNFAAKHLHLSPGSIPCSVLHIDNVSGDD
ncbi:MLO protein homolog 1-like [Cornus florida]|uniref:MLO protein homolog 1-like n=1 Tax=Cornus florida TaxID=4283 RepID=UPI00289C2305|nr:MLO protein homolog 1-like [Cornus florida]